jgi:hypothetical protein
MAVIQIPTELYKKTMQDISHIASKGAPAKIKEPPSFYTFVGITLVLILIGWILSEFANWTEVHNNWDSYKCSPNIMPFAKFYGYDLEETINFCMSEAVKKNAPGVIIPLYQGINKIATTIDGVYDRAAAIQGGVTNLLSGFQTFVMNFANSFRLIGVRIRVSLVKIRDIFDKVFGMFTSFALAGVSAITFGSNLMCNPLVTFIGTIAGVEICCFAPGTLVLLKEGAKPIEHVILGDVLYDGSIVTSTLLFHGLETSMVRINGIHVSANHSLLRSTKFVEAGDHPDSEEAESVPFLYCLNTSSNCIWIQGKDKVMFTDYDESSNPDVIREAKAAAEHELNGYALDTDSDYSLGLDPKALVHMQNGYRQLDQIKVGDVVRGGAYVVGVIREICADCCKTPGGLLVSSAQLIYNGSWSRNVFPRVTGRVILYQLVLSDNSPIYLHNKDHTEIVLVRDYMEVHSAAVQAPYDTWIAKLKLEE